MAQTSHRDEAGPNRSSFISKTKLLAVSLILIVATGAFYLGQVVASPSPTVSRVVTPGAIGPCTWFISLDGTTPVAEAMVGGLSVSPGDNIVGTAGQDMGAYITNNGLIASNTRLCFGTGTFNFNTQILVQSIQSFSITGLGNQTVLQATASMPANKETIKVFSSTDFTLAYVKMIGFPTGTGQADLTIQLTKQALIEHVVFAQASDDGTWVCGDGVDLSFVSDIWMNNGNSTNNGSQNNGGLEIDANGCGGNPNRNISIINSVAFGNYGPGFAVNNCNGSTSSPCAGGTHPNTEIQFTNDVSYSNRPTSKGGTFPVGFSLYNWNDTTIIGCKTFNNTGTNSAGFRVNGATNGPLIIIAQSDDTTPYTLATTLVKPLFVRVQIGWYNPANTNMNGGGYAQILSQSTVTTTSGSLVSTGIGVSSVFPQITGQMMISFSSCVTSTSTGIITVGVYRTTGGVPSAGTAASGNSIYKTANYVALANQNVTISGSIVDTGGTINTSYAWYLVWSTSAGTASLFKFTGSIIVDEV